MTQLTPDQEKAKQILSNALMHAFREGQKVDQLSDQASEYWSPHFEYDVAPELFQSVLSTLEENKNQGTIEKIMETLPADGLVTKEDIKSVIGAKSLSASELSEEEKAVLAKIEMPLTAIGRAIMPYLNQNKKDIGELCRVDNASLTKMEKWTLARLLARAFNERYASSINP